MWCDLGPFQQCLLHDEMGEGFFLLVQFPTSNKREPTRIKLDKNTKKGEESEDWDPKHLRGVHLASLQGTLKDIQSSHSHSRTLITQICEFYFL